MILSIKYQHDIAQILLSCFHKANTRGNFMQTHLDSIIVNSKLPAQRSVIWMHGLGADGYDFVDIASKLQLPDELAVRFVFPHAPIRSVTWASGMQMRAWFDINLTSDFWASEIDIRQSQGYIEELINTELQAGIPARNIVLVGFSQGGALALHCGMRFNQTLGGILSLSGFLPLEETIAKEKNIANTNTSIMMMHGDCDSRVPVAWAYNAYSFLQNIGLNVTLQIYKGIDHTVCQEEIYAIRDWMNKIFLNTGDLFE